MSCLLLNDGYYGVPVRVRVYTLVILLLSVITSSISFLEQHVSPPQSWCLAGQIDMPLGCVQQTERHHVAPMGGPRKYESTYTRAEDQTTYLRRYVTPPVQLPSALRTSQRPWDAPARQLNELGPPGYNYFRAAQTDELRRWHAKQLVQSKRSPSLRAQEAIMALNNHLGYDPMSSWPQTPKTPTRSTEALAAARATSSDRGHHSSMDVLGATPDDRLPTPNALLAVRPPMSALMASSSTRGELY